VFGGIVEPENSSNFILKRRFAMSIFDSSRVSKRHEGADQLRTSIRSVLNYGEGRRILEQLKENKISVDDAINLITNKINEIDIG